MTGAADTCGIERRRISGLFHISLKTALACYCQGNHLLDPQCHIAFRAGENERQLVGASSLAMDVNDNACCLNVRVVLAFFASKLAPTRGTALSCGQVGCQAASLLLWLLIFLPRREAEWRFCAVGTRSRTGASACRALARHRTSGARALWLLGAGRRSAFPK
jgi:hypothetical protein